MWGNEKELIGICKKKKIDIISGNILMCWFLLVNFYFLRYLIIVKYYNLYFNMNVIFCRSCNIFVFYFYDM